jgi:hypothetical protein
MAGPGEEEILLLHWRERNIAVNVIIFKLLLGARRRDPNTKQGGSGRVQRSQRKAHCGLKLNFVPGTVQSRAREPARFAALRLSCQLTPAVLPRKGKAPSVPVMGAMEGEVQS